MNAELIREQLRWLQLNDPGLRYFGAGTHGYELGEPLGESEVSAFEATHGVVLPSDYRFFVTACGDGGAGPGYGLFPLCTSEAPNPPPTCGRLREPFPHTEYWNLSPDRWPTSKDGDDFERLFEDTEDEYFASHLTNGALPISHQGCGHYDILIVNGPEYGHIWFDSRVSDQGIGPLHLPDLARMTFAEWYMGWLMAAVAAVKSVSCSQVGRPKAKWWRRWRMLR